MSENAGVVRRVYAARAAGDFDEVARLFADDVVWHEPMRPGAKAMAGMPSWL
jgi:ketosteroid isomerase-like protein